MQIVPLQAVPSQRVSVTLANQSCQIDVFQKSTGVFVNLYVNNAPIILGVIAENLNRIVRSLYLGFVGDFTFIDNMGNDNPDYTGLGDRWQLAYLSPDEVPS